MLSEREHLYNFSNYGTINFRFQSLPVNVLLRAHSINVQCEQQRQAFAFFFSFFFLNLSFALQSSVSQAAKCIGERDQGNLELMSFLPNCLYNL